MDDCAPGKRHLDFCHMDGFRKYAQCVHCGRVEFANGGSGFGGYHRPGNLDPERFESGYQPIRKPLPEQV